MQIPAHQLVPLENRCAHVEHEVGKCAVVVPCFNEAKRLDVDAFARFAATGEGVEFIFVNDGSTDETMACLLRIHEEAPHAVSALSLEANRGKGEAVRTGLIWAAARGYTAIGFWDADLATPLEDILGFRQVLSRNSQIDVVWGTRINLLGHRIERNLLRRQIGRGFSTASAISVGVGIRDALCGAKMFRNGRILKHIISRTYSSRWIFDVEMLARMRWLCQRDQIDLADKLYEYPLDRWYEISGSKLRMKDFVRATKELASLFVTYRLLGSRLAIHPSPRMEEQKERLVDQPAAYRVVFEASASQIKPRQVA